MSNLSEDIISVVSDVFDSEGVSLESNFDDLAATSVLFLRLMVAIQNRFDVEIDVVDMYSVEDVADLVRLVEERGPQNSRASA